MKRTIVILVFMIGVMIFSCTPDNYEIFDFDSNPARVDSIGLVPNSHILYADGISELNITVRAFEIIETWRKDKVALPDGTFGTKDSLHIDVLKVQNSRIPEAIEFYKDDGTKLLDNARITTTTVEDFNVYVKIGDIQSPMFQIDVREPFPEKPKVTIPVIFHVLESDGVITPAVNTEYFQKELDGVNAIMSKRAVNASHGANANIEFKLAQYAPDGTMLEEKGINRQRTSLQSVEMKPFLVEHTWDLKKYLNVYICTYPPSNKKPHTKLIGVDTLPGLNFEFEVQADDDLDISEPENSGIIIGAYYNSSGAYYFWQINQFNFLNAFAEYLGLYDSRGEDYCSDTYMHGYDYSFNEYWVRNNDGFLFRPTNIKGNPSLRTVVTGEQAERIHWVLNNCPTHWAWKSDFAFTGTE